MGVYLGLEDEKLVEIDNERIVKLDEDVKNLIQQERALFLNTDYNLFKV